MITLRWASLLIALVCLAIVSQSGLRDGVWLLGVIAGAVFLWSVGLFSRDLWVQDGSSDISHLGACDCPADHSCEVNEGVR